MPVREIVNKQKVPKDTVLNNIMKEIDEENGIVVDVPIEKKQKKIIPKKKKKRSWLHVFFNFTLLALILFLLFVVYVIVMATTEETVTKPIVTPSPTQIVVPVQASKPVEKNTKNINVLKKKTVELTPTNTKQKSIKIPHKDTLSLSPEKEEALIRKRAKEALMQQMKN